MLFVKLCTTFKVLFIYCLLFVKIFVKFSVFGFCTSDCSSVCTSFCLYLCPCATANERNAFPRVFEVLRLMNGAGELYLFIAGCLSVGSALDNGLVRTPPMGWLAWTRFMCQVDCKNHPKDCISENLFMEMAEVLVREGYRDAGYTRVNIDDCWAERKRDPSGALLANPQRFSHGIKWLATYMHERGLKLGIYANYGKRTCMGYAGTEDSHMEKDAEIYASWDIDMLKMDGCFTDIALFDTGYPKMGRALNKTGRSIVYACSWPFYVLSEARKQPDYPTIVKNCNMWRNFADIQISWESVVQIINFYDNNQDMLAKFHGPGHWNDPDMIIIGNPGLTLDQAKVQMGIWCLWSAPLLMSNDLRDMRPEFREVLLNKKLIDVDQDKLGIMGKRISQKGRINIYRKPMTPVEEEDNLITDHSYAVAFFNRDEASMQDMEVSLAELGLVREFGYEVEDLFSGHNYGRVPSNRKFKFKMKPTSIVMWKATILTVDGLTPKSWRMEKRRRRPVLPDFQEKWSWYLMGLIIFLLIYRIRRKLRLSVRLRYRNV